MSIEKNQQPDEKSAETTEKIAPKDADTGELSKDEADQTSGGLLERF